MKVPQLDLTTQYQSIKIEIDTAITTVLESGKVINGDNVKKIENSIATYSDNKYGIGVANGSDAIFIALKALNISPYLFCDCWKHCKGRSYSHICGYRLPNLQY